MKLLPVHFLRTDDAGRVTARTFAQVEFFERHGRRVEQRFGLVDERLRHIQRLKYKISCFFIKSPLTSLTIYYFIIYNVKRAAFSTVQFYKPLR